MTTPTPTIFVPYHALEEALDAALPATVARTDAANTFTEDQTINADLYVTGEINPARRLEQRPKIEQLIGEGQGRTLLSNDLVAGMSLQYDDAITAGRVTVGNYDTQTYQPLVLEADHIALTTGSFPPGMEEHVRVHPSGGVTVGAGADHQTDPGVGTVWTRQLAGAPAVLQHPGGYPGGVTAFLRADGTFAAPPSVSAFYPYGFSTQTTAPPAAQTLRVNAPHPYTAVTALWAAFQNSVSEDLYWSLMRIPVGSEVFVQDKDTHAQYLEVVTTGAPIDKGTYVEVPVAWRGNGTALATQAVIVQVREQAALLAQLAALEARIAALEGG